MTIQVTTKSVDRDQSSLSKSLITMVINTIVITDCFLSVRVGPTRQMKTGGAMNFVDMSDLRGETVGYMDSITMQRTEQVIRVIEVIRVIGVIRKLVAFFI